jgi:hypothetical protein
LHASSPTDNTTLLSAEKAKQRLREIVEGFFFWRLKTEDVMLIEATVRRPPAAKRPRAAGKERPRAGETLGGFTPRYEI